MLSDLTPAERTQLIKFAPNRVRDEAAEVGTPSHACIQKFVLAHDVPPIEDVEVSARLYQFQRFTEDYNPQWKAVECVVFNDTWNYAGTFDGVADIPELGGICILDVKTGKSVHDKAALQLNAYANGEWMEVGPDDRALPLGKIDRAYVLHLQKTQYALQEVVLSEENFQAFTVLCHLRGVMEAFTANAFRERFVSKETREEKHARRTVAV